jgi:hypothetical protein
VRARGWRRVPHRRPPACVHHRPSARSRALIPLGRGPCLDCPPLSLAGLTHRFRIPACSSIAGRRASGFLQVSLSKESRHQHRGTPYHLAAEALPMNASDYSGGFVIRSPGSPRSSRLWHPHSVASREVFASTAVLFGMTLESFHRMRHQTVKAQRRQPVPAGTVGAPHSQW